MTKLAKEIWSIFTYMRSILRHKEIFNVGLTENPSKLLHIPNPINSRIIRKNAQIKLTEIVNYIDG